jgi:hypothetical protein
VALGPSHHGASQVEPGRRDVAAGHDELLRRLEALVQGVDVGLEAVDHLLRHGGRTRLELAAVLRQRRQLGHQHPQVAEDPHQHVVELTGGVGARQADHRLGLVDAAVRGGQLGVLGDPAAVEQPGRAVVARLRVHLHARTVPVGPTPTLRDRRGHSITAAWLSEPPTRSRRRACKPQRPWRSR